MLLSKNKPISAGLTKPLIQYGILLVVIELILPFIGPDYSKSAMSLVFLFPIALTLRFNADLKLSFYLDPIKLCKNNLSNPSFFIVQSLAYRVRDANTNPLQ